MGARRAHRRRPLGSHQPRPGRAAGSTATVCELVPQAVAPVPGARARGIHDLDAGVVHLPPRVGVHEDRLHRGPGRRVGSVDLPGDRQDVARDPPGTEPIARRRHEHRIVASEVAGEECLTVGAEQPAHGSERPAPHAGARVVDQRQEQVDVGPLAEIAQGAHGLVVAGGQQLAIAPPRPRRARPAWRVTGSGRTGSGRRGPRSPRSRRGGRPGASARVRRAGPAGVATARAPRVHRGAGRRRAGRAARSSGGRGPAIHHARHDRPRRLPVGDERTGRGAPPRRVVRAQLGHEAVKFHVASMARTATGHEGLRRVRGRSPRPPGQ